MILLGPQCILLMQSTRIVWLQRTMWRAHKGMLFCYSVLLKERSGKGGNKEEFG